MIGCTAVRLRDLGSARLLACDFLEHHPGARFSITIVDPPPEGIELAEPGVELLAVPDLDVEPVTWRHLVTMFSPDELPTAVKPFMLRRLLDDATCVLYLAPWIKLFANLDPLIERTRAHGIALTPHRTTPIPDDALTPTEAQVLSWGMCNLDCIGVASRGRPFLDWWSRRLFTEAVHSEPGNLTTHQRWVDLAVPTFGPYVEPSPAYNVAYWNADERDLDERSDGVYVGDEPLRFINFAGYDPTTPWVLSTQTDGRPRVLLSEHAVLARLCEERRRELRAAADHATTEGGWQATPEGVELTPTLRAFVRSESIGAVAQGADLPATPFDDDGGAAFAELLTGTADVPWDLPLLAYLTWCEQPGLQEAFQGLHDGEVRSAFLDWVHTSGVEVFAGWAELQLGDYPYWPRRVRRTGNAVDGVDVLGHLTAEGSAAVAGRRLVTGFRAAGLRVSTADCDGIRGSHREFPIDDRLAHETLLLAVNPDAVGPVINDLGPDLLPSRVIGQWLWEVERFPDVLAPAIDVLDEVWVPTEHIATALRPLAGDRVRVVPLPLSVDPGQLDALRRLPADGDAPFTFLSVFDATRGFERANPVGIVEAFRLAFRDGEGPRLVIRSTNGWPAQLDQLRWAARGRTDIDLTEGPLAPDEVDRMLWRADCYVSLHRAEAVGFRLARAMSMGKPTIATGYSGNVDFMTADNSYLVPFHLERVGPGHDPYPPDAQWALPEVQSAAAAMRRVTDSAGEARARGALAATDLAARFSPAVTGAAMRRALEGGPG